MFEISSLVVLALVTTMLGISLRWYFTARARREALLGGLSVLRNLAPELPPSHPVRRRLESSPVAEISFEEIVALVREPQLEPSARVLLQLADRAAWVDRFAQFAVHLGIMGTVLALLSMDASDLQGFRSSLPKALGTTFWGLVGALSLSAVAGLCDSLLGNVTRQAREALVAGFANARD